VALGEFHPDIVVYNAGTDILQGDSLGLLSISEQVGYRRRIIRILYLFQTWHILKIFLCTCGDLCSKTVI